MEIYENDLDYENLIKNEESGWYPNKEGKNINSLLFKYSSEIIKIFEEDPYGQKTKDKIYLNTIFDFINQGKRLEILIEHNSFKNHAQKNMSTFLSFWNEWLRQKPNIIVKEATQPFYPVVAHLLKGGTQFTIKDHKIIRLELSNEMDTGKLGINTLLTIKNISEIYDDFIMNKSKDIPIF